MKNLILKIAAFAFFYQSTVVFAFSQLEFDIQQQNKEYFDLFYYAVKLDPSLATDKTVNDYIKFIRPTSIERAVDEFDLHELYEAERKLFLQKTSEHNHDTSNIFEVLLGAYNFDSSSFPLVFISRAVAKIKEPCVKRGLRNMCLDRPAPHGLPSTIKIRLNYADIPNHINITPEKAKLLIATSYDRRLISNIQLKDGVVIVHNEKYRPLEWEIVLSPKSYTIRSNSNEIFLEKKDQ